MRGEQLRALFIDINGHIAYIFNDWTHSEENYQAFNNNDPSSKKRYLINLITRLRVNYIVYERREIDLVPKREGVNRLEQYIELKHWLIRFCHSQGIKGAVIFLGEAHEYIKNETNWCWRDPKPQIQHGDDEAELNPLYCKRHKLLAPCENWYKDKEIPIKDLVDARAIYEIWERNRFFNNKEWMKERERIHQLEPKRAWRESYNWEANKSTREQREASTQRNNNISNEITEKER